MIAGASAGKCELASTARRGRLGRLGTGNIRLERSWRVKHAFGLFLFGVARDHMLLAQVPIRS